MNNFEDFFKIKHIFSTSVDILCYRSEFQPNQLAFTFLSDGETESARLSYRELDRLSRACAAKLQALGLSGERALLLYQPGLDYIAAFFGCLYAGVVAVPVYPTSSKRKAPRIKAIKADAQASVALTTTAILSNVQSFLAKTTDLGDLQWVTTDNLDSGIEESWQKPIINRDTLAFLQYTSGSTGTPKGVMLSHKNLLHNAAMTYRLMEHSPTSQFVSWLPTYHDMGLIGGILQPLYGGFPCILMPPASFLQHPYRWLQAISRYKGTTSGAPNFAYELCIHKITPEQRETLDLSTWDVAFNGAESIRWDTLERFSATFADCGFRQQAFYPCYGMAEATLIVSGGQKTAPPVLKTIQISALERNHVVEASAQNENVCTLVGCGQTIPEQQVVIAHPEILTRCSPDEVGEIWVSGTSVGQGYWNRTEQTEQTFHAYLSDTGEGPFLRTGDLGFLHNGELFVTGRLKDLIIIRGRNLYPQDIELTTERSHPALRPGSGAAFSIEVDNEEQLVVVQELEFRQKPNVEEVTAAICQAVAEEHEVQAYAVVLIKPGTIPKTSSGKIQRSACRTNFLEEKLDVQSVRIIGRSETVENERRLTHEELLTVELEKRQQLVESYLQRQVARLLRVEISQVDYKRSLSTFGLDSLKVFDLKNRIEVDLGVDISVTDLFEGASIAQIVSDILTQLTASSKSLKVPPILPVSQEQAIPLSFSQQLAWVMNQLEPRSAFCIVPTRMRLIGSLNAKALKWSINAIIQRHQVLRTTFATVDGQPVPTIAPTLTVTLPIVDLQEISDDEQSQLVNQIDTEEAQRPFDLAHGPLVRSTLLRLKENEHLLLMSIHHIVSDGWSIGLFIQEMAKLYKAVSTNKPSPLNDLPIQYADFAVWQRQWLQGEVLETQLAYWKEQLGFSLPMLELPIDRPRPPVPTFQTATEIFVLPKILIEGLKALSQQEGMTLFLMLFTAYKALLYQYTGQSDIVVTTPIAARNQAEIKDLIGFFANPLVLRTNLSGNPTFRDLLDRVQKITLEAYKYQDLPFVKLLEELSPDSRHNPLSQVWFDLLSYSYNEVELPDLKVEFSVSNSGFGSKFDLLLMVIELKEVIQLQWVYSTDLFDAATINQMARHYQTLLKAIVANPQQRLSDLLLCKEAKRQLLETPNNTVEIQQVEAALLSVPFVEDCRVLARETETSSSKLLAYVVFSQRFSLNQLQSHLKNLLPAHQLPYAYIPLSTLPLTKAGYVDKQALGRLEVINCDLIQQWEEQLQSLSEIDRVAVVVQEQVESQPPLHLSELLSNWNDFAASAAEESIIIPVCQVTVQEDSEPKVLAISDGGLLNIGEDAPTTLINALIQTATKYKDKGIFYIQNDGSKVFQTYASLLKEAKSILTGLSQMGFKPHDTAILQIENLKNFFPTFWACILGGIRPATVTVATRYDDKNSIVCKLLNTWKFLNKPPILASDSLIESLSGLKETLQMSDMKILSVSELRNYPPSASIHQSHPHEVAFFQLTSGSTGVPKCIQETHRGIVCHIHASQQFNAYQPEDISLNWLPMDHVVPLLTYHIKDVYLGCQQVQIPTDMILVNPLKWLDLIEEYQVTHTWSPNFGYKLVSDCLSKVENKNWNLSSIKFFLNAGEQVTLPVVQEFLRLVTPFQVQAHTIQPAFGMAEVCTCMTYQNQFDVETAVHRFKKSSLNGYLKKADSNDTNTVNFINLGLPVPGVQIRIVDKDNQLLPEEVIGRLQIKGDVVTPGYLNNQAANQEAFVGNGWFNTGDLGFILNGRLTITGREKELIIIHGANYYCYEIEDIVNEIDGIEPTYVAACGLDNPNTGTESVAIFFTPTVNNSEENIKNIDLIKAIRTKVASNLGISPTYVIPVAKDAFPKTTSGKIQRTQLKKLLATGYFQDVLKDIDIQLENENTLPDWFYRKIWRLKETITLMPQNPTGAYLIFLDQLGLGVLLCTELNQINQLCVCVEPGTEFAQLEVNRYRINRKNPDHYQRLFKSLAENNIWVNQVVHLWTYSEYSGEISNLKALEQAQEGGVYSLLFLVQALAANQGDKESVHLLVISSYAQVAVPDDEIAYEKTAILGFSKTISQEMPWLVCQHIDLPVESININVMCILRELQVVKGDREVAYRNGQRLVPRLEKVDMRQEAKQELPLRRGGMYLLSGGLGGIGVEIAQYLLKHYQARLLLVGRNPIPEKSEWKFHIEQADATSERIKAYQRLEQLGGEIIYKAMDICNLDKLQQLVDQAQSQWQCRLDGVIHLAGIFQERMLTEETQETVAAVLHPKMFGAWALHQLIKNQPHAIFISFSSVNSFFGGVAAGAYAAANSFLDGLAHYQKYKSLIRSYCFAWSMWGETGMSRNNQMKDLSRNQGYHILTAKQGLYSLLAGLRHDQAQLLVGLDGNKQHIRRYVQTKSYGVQKLTAYFTASTNDLSVTQFPELVVYDQFRTRSNCEFVKLREIPLTETGEIDREKLKIAGNDTVRVSNQKVAPQNQVECQLANIWQEVLRVTQVSIHDNFFDLGGGSLLMVQIQSKLQDIFGRNLSMVEMFKYPTIHSLAKHLSQSSSEEPSKENHYRAKNRNVYKSSMEQQKQLRQKHRATNKHYKNSNN